MTFSLLISPHLSFPVFSQNDGSNCGKEIILPSAAELCNNNDYQMEKAEMWYEFTANSSVHEIILSPSATQPQAEITKLKLFENKCPELHLKQEVTTQAPELPRMRMEQLVIGQKYRVKAEREPRIEIGNYRMCLTRDVVGGGGDGGNGGGGGGGNGGTNTDNCKPAANPWGNPTGTTFLNLCPNYNVLNLGLPEDNRKVDFSISSKNDNNRLGNAFIHLKNIYNSVGRNEPSISFETDASPTRWLLGVNTFESYFLIGRNQQSTGYAEFFRITNEGKVGIGEPNPQSKLHVAGNIELTGELKMPVSSVNALNYWKKNGVNVYFLDGKVGIGTNDPQSKLHVNGNIELTGELKMPVSSVNALNYFKKNNEGNVYFNEGKVGIGTNDPQSTLHVNGNIELTGELKMPVSSLNALNYFKKNNEGNLYFNEGKVGIGIDFTSFDENQLGFTGNLNVSKLLDIYNTSTSGSCLRFRDLSTKVNRHYICDNLTDNVLEIHPGAGAGALNIVKVVGSMNVTGKVGIGTINPQSELAVNGTITARKLTTTPDGWSDFVFEPGYKWLKGKELKEHLLKNKHLPGFPSADDVLNKGIEHTEMIAKLLQTIEELKLENIEQYEEIEKLKEDLKKLNR